LHIKKIKPLQAIGIRQTTVEGGHDRQDVIDRRDGHLLEDIRQHLTQSLCIKEPFVGINRVLMGSHGMITTVFAGTWCIEINGDLLLCYGGYAATIVVRRMTGRGSNFFGKRKENKRLVG
jgi:hypothetical protein